MIKKVVAIGPESTGKSTLCEQLAAHFKTAWVPEYAREYLLQHGTNYQYKDLLTIAEGQLRSEERIVEDIEKGMYKSDLVFIDTDLYVMKVWSEFVFNKCENSILTRIANRQYDLYLLCNNDLPWEKDELREYPDLKRRDQLFHHYKDAMVNQNTAWVEIRGNHEERLGIAIDAVNRINRNL